MGDALTITRRRFEQRKRIQIMSGGISSVQPFLDALAARTPTPGGGAAAAVCGAVATALAEMVAAYSVRPDTEPSIHQQVTSIRTGLAHSRALLVRLAEEDAAAYEAMAESRKKNREKNGPDVEIERRTATMIAAIVPLQIIAAASAALSMMDELAANASGTIISDLGAAGELARAAAHAAAFSVRANLATLRPDDRQPLERELDSLLAHTESTAAMIRAKTAHGDRR